MRQLSISAAWDETKAVLAHEGGLLATVALALIVLPQVVMAVAGVPVGPESTMLSRVLYIAVVLLGLVAQVALNRLAIPPPVLVRDAISTGLVRLLPVVLVLLALMIAVVLTTIALAIPLNAAGLTAMRTSGQPPLSVVAVLLVLVALSFAIIQLIFPIAAVETGNPIRLVSRSWQLARGNYLRLLAFIVIVFVGLGLVLIASQVGLGSVIVLLLGQPHAGSMSALVLGLIAGLLQAAFTTVTAVMLARIYLQLSGGQAQATVPSSGT
jgi:hypothetical protein